MLPLSWLNVYNKKIECKLFLGVKLSHNTVKRCTYIDIVNIQITIWPLRTLGWSQKQFDHWSHWKCHRHNVAYIHFLSFFTCVVLNFYNFCYKLINKTKQILLKSMYSHPISGISTIGDSVLCKIFKLFDNIFLHSIISWAPLWVFDVHNH